VKNVILQEKEREASQEKIRKEEEKEKKAKQEKIRKEEEKERKAKQALALQQKKEKERKERKERLDRPKKELGSFYEDYVKLKKCYEVRKGYALVHVNSVEMRNIKSWAKLIEKGIFKKYPKVKSMKDQIWKEFTKSAGSSISGDFSFLDKLLCDNSKSRYNKLIKTYGGGGTAKKDF
jgi:hypothetical protein